MRAQLLCMVLLCGRAGAAVVTVQLTDISGAPIADGAVIFDPQDNLPPPTHPVAVIDQKDLQFVPRMSILRTGTAVSFPNSDQVRHQVYSFSPAKTFTLKLYAGAPKLGVIFEKPGLVVLGCNIHDSMVAFVGVVDTPYFAKSDRSGSAAVDLPPGRYRLRIWHAQMSHPFASKMIQVAAESQRLPIALGITRDNATPPDWPE